MIEIKRNCDIASLTTFGIHAKAAAVVFYDEEEDLREIFADESLPGPFKQIGEGSNLLFTRDFPGTLLVSRIKFYHDKRYDDGRALVTCGAGVPLDELCDWTATRGLWGLENLSGIPGTVGAAPVQNVGAYGVEAGQLIVDVVAFSTEGRNFVTIPLSPKDFGYRTSIFKEANRDDFIIVKVRFMLSTEPKPRLDYGNLRQMTEVVAPGVPLCSMIVRQAVLLIRESKLPDPLKVGSAGSFFKNPVIDVEQFASILSEYPDAPHYVQPDGRVKVPAAWLIDKSGLKGQRVGGASLWPSQPLVIVNTDGTATADDVLGLERLIVDTVKQKFNIILTPEVEHIGA